SSSTQGVMSPAQAQKVSATDTVSMKPCAASIILRRSKVSAIAPAGSDSSMIGSVTEAWTNATISVLPIEVIIQEAPTDWISPPKFDARLAIHTARKIGLFSGERKDGRAGCGPGAESEEATGSPCDICIGGPRLAAYRPAPECDPLRNGRRRSLPVV